MRLILVSNRLPITLQHDDAVSFKESIGGLVTGLGAFKTHIVDGKHATFDRFLWFGWPGQAVPKKRQQEVTQRLAEAGYVPVFLKSSEINEFYFGYCNKTVWPLFHYFLSEVEQDADFWQAYVACNNRFFEHLKEKIFEDDLIWIHDYHLMLLGQLLRRAFPQTKICFFLHIPFPTYDVFRRLTFEEQRMLLTGILGADVVGFHVQAYRKNFLECVSKILPAHVSENEVLFDGRRVHVGVFPMGIYYEGMQRIVSAPQCRNITADLRARFENKKIVLSVDRLDYTKGIPNRLAGFEQFLQEHPEWHGRIVLILVVAPSRREIPSYAAIKREIDEIAGRINGSIGSFDWIPVFYQYRQVGIQELSALYAASDVAMVTPLIDGMNLICKEFVAAHQDEKGILILSEMAGATSELKPSAISVNPFNPTHIKSALEQAMQMTDAEIKQRSLQMHSRLKHYSVLHWAEDMLIKTSNTPDADRSKKYSHSTELTIQKKYQSAKSRLFLLDYDGTLVPLNAKQAKPDRTLLQLLNSLAQDPSNQVVIVTGRDRKFLDENLSGINLAFSAEFSAWKYYDGKWESCEQEGDWINRLHPIMDGYAKALNASFVELKTGAIVWDYRNADKKHATELAHSLISELRDKDLLPLNLDLFQGQHSLIVRNHGNDKGSAAKFWLNKNAYDFILAIGDDDTDEELFQALPENAFSIRIGKYSGGSKASFYLNEQHSVPKLLTNISQATVSNFHSAFTSTNHERQTTAI